MSFTESQRMMQKHSNFNGYCQWCGREWRCPIYLRHEKIVLDQIQRLKDLKTK